MSESPTPPGTPPPTPRDVAGENPVPESEAGLPQELPREEATPEAVEAVRGLREAVQREVARAVIGMDREVDACLVAVLAGGHALLEGPPGVAKTLLVRSLATALGGSFSRVQFTPDLMPADVTGTSVFHPNEARFEFHPGPVFAQVLLCDEINRAPAKTQAALLEAMQERSVTYDGERHPLPTPFIVFATQNPIEHEGTYPLPEAQLDRFLLHVEVGYPGAEVEQRLLLEAHGRSGSATPEDLGVTAVTTPAARDRILGLVSSIRVDPEIAGYVVRLLESTRGSRALALGASPRAGVLLLRAAKAQAAMDGRAYVLPDDIKRLFKPVMRHRVLLEATEEIEGSRVDGVLEHLLETVEVSR